MLSSDSDNDTVADSLVLLCSMANKNLRAQQIIMITGIISHSISQN